MQIRHSILLVWIRPFVFLVLVKMMKKSSVKGHCGTEKMSQFEPFWSISLCLLALLRVLQKWTREEQLTLFKLTFWPFQPKHRSPAAAGGPHVSGFHWGEGSLYERLKLFRPSLQLDATDIKSSWRGVHIAFPNEHAFCSAETSASVSEAKGSRGFRFQGFCFSDILLCAWSEGEPEHPEYAALFHSMLLSACSFVQSSSLLNVEAFAWGLVKELVCVWSLKRPHWERNSCSSACVALVKL